MKYTQIGEIKKIGYAIKVYDVEFLSPVTEHAKTNDYG
jgi:hypothetical protein